MSTYRFGDDYRLNVDFEHQDDGWSFGWDEPDWDAVRWVEIDNVRFVLERTCKKIPGKMHYGERRPKCSECGYGLGDSRWAYCPSCGAKVVE